MSSGVQSGQYHPAFDGLRGVAVLLVITCHVGFVIQETTETERFIRHVTESMWIGVDLFFALSGFLITNVLINTKEAENRFISFYARRALRILPLYYLFLFLALDFGAPSVHSAWLYVFFVENWVPMIVTGRLHLGHLWSLAVEEQFYLIWPIAFFFLSLRQFVRFAVLVLIVGNVLRVILFLTHPRIPVWPVMDIYRWTLTRTDGLILGSLLAIGLRDQLVVPVINRLLKPALVCSFLCLAALILRYGSLAGNPAAMIAGLPALGIGGTALVAYLSTKRKRGPAWLCAAGKYSYAMYLFHVPLTTYTYRVMPKIDGLPERLAYYAFYAMAVGIASYLLSWFSWCALEEPFLRLKRYVKPRFMAVPVEQTANQTAAT